MLLSSFFPPPQPDADTQASEDQDSEGQDSKKTGNTASDSDEHIQSEADGEAQSNG